MSNTHLPVKALSNNAPLNSTLTTPERDLQTDKPDPA
jgi:hypothetical protein